jgi:DNA-binding MarR family transcriptional regulator
MSPRQTTTAEAIQQRKPFRSTAQEATIALLITADAVQRRIDQVFTADGAITSQQYNVLRILRGAGPEGLPTLAIGERMLQRTPGVTRIVDRLVEKGLAERREAPHDRRQVLCLVTKAGLALLARFDGAIDAFDDDVLACLSVAEQRNLAGLLDRVRNHQPG